MTTFLLVRHGQAKYELAEERRLFGGMRDLVPLTELGRTQAKRAAEQLAGRSVQSLITSPMTRAMETAQIIARESGLVIEVEFDLHEWLPDLSCRYDTYSYADKQAQELHDCAGEWPVGQTREWEPLSRVRERAKNVLVKYVHLEQVVVVAHGMLILALTGRQAANGEICEFQLG